MKKITWVFCILGCMALDLRAQSNAVASGGIASGSGGSICYSVGQLNYTCNVGSGGSLSEGVQQPYEIIPTGIEKVEGINLMTIYPNPGVSSVNLRVENVNSENLFFQFYDANGKLLLTQKISSTETSVPVETLSAGNYILKVTDNNKEVQSFNVIKNK